MQNKGAIKLLAIIFTLVCIYQLSFTLITKNIESKAKDYANGDPLKERTYLDSVSGEVVYNFLFGLRKYTYTECKEREINLGLDLKGGMNVTLEISVVDIIRSMAIDRNDTALLSAIALAHQYEKESREDFVTLFGKAFKSLEPNGRLAAFFSTPELKDKINFNSTNEEVLSVIKKEADGAIENSFNILRTRIDRFGVTQPNIQKMGTAGRILVELPGVKEPERVRKLLQGTAKLEFWETFENGEVYKYLLDANNKIKEIEGASEKKSTDAVDSLLTPGNDTSKTAVADNAPAGTKKDGGKETPLATTDTAKKDTSSLLSELEKDTTGGKKDTALSSQNSKNYPLFTVLMPWVSRDGKLLDGPCIGISSVKDTSKVNRYMAMKQIKSIFPREMKFLWTVKPYDKDGNFFQLIAIKVTNRDGRASLEGDAVTNARPEFGNNKSTAEVSMSMNAEGARTWARLTKENIKRCIAIVLDNYVYSFPVVQNEIKGGNSSITGNFDVKEAKDLSNVLKSGKLPAPAKIIQEAVVGPTLGKEAINAGLLSFVFAFIGVLLYMTLYYNRAGMVANIALFANVFFTFGVLASLGAVLTLPGIAGIVLTFAMAVDSNVIIYERMREEMRAGKGMLLVVKDGFWHAMSAIIDGHVTTILTGIVLFIFGSGPVQGFATTLIIGLVLSLFSSIFIARLVFESMLKRKMNITLGNKYTINAFTKTKIDFIGIRKTLYLVSATIICIGIISLFVRGMSRGIDFKGGRSYIVRFDNVIPVSDLRVSLGKVYGEEPEVKTFGPDNQVKITTKYLIDDNSITTDSLVETKLYEGLKSYYKTAISYQDFSAAQQDKKVGKLSSEKVGPIIAYDLLVKSFFAVIFGLIIIFIYITIRFKNWQFGLGGVISLFHDTMVIITLFSLFHGIMPFNLDVDQSFIAALLTIIGYSIMDTVIIFDRIREYRGLHPKWDLRDNINAAINSTLGRTINTSGITLVVLIVIFIFGGEILRGFIFALLAGVAIGTYSSVFNATPVAYDIIMFTQRRKEKKLAAQGKK